MSAPPKPWERVGAAAAPTSDMAGTPPCCLPGGGGPLDPLRQSSTTLGPSTSMPPPIPGRSTVQSSAYGTGYGGGMSSGYGGGYSSYGGLGSSYGGIGSYGGMGTGSMYSPYGSGLYGSSMYGSSMYGGGYGMNRIGGIDNAPNSFVQMAEENSRQAFQSIEGIVQAVGSVSMMLESTYSAVYNSFRAVIGVADHFSRMKATFAQVFSALAIIRTLKWMLRRLLVLLRLREAAPNEEIWSEAAAAGLDAVGGLPGSKKPTTSWPLLLFFGVIMGGPWLIWRFLSSLKPKQADGSEWASGADEHFVALAEHDFEGEKEDELSFRRGQRINIAPKDLQPRLRGWLMASVDGQQVGIIPANYVKILGRRPGTKTEAQAAPAVQQYTGPAPLPNQPLLPTLTDTTPSTAPKAGCCGGKAAAAEATPKKGCCGSKNQSPRLPAGQFEAAFGGESWSQNDGDLLEADKLT